MRAVIIGNGIAGIEAAVAIRAREEDWEITVVSEESDHLFSRTALMYVFCGQLSHRNIEPYERDLYERMGFRRVRGRASGIDVHQKTVTLSNGESLPYDRLLIACGSRPRPGMWPNSDLNGIGHFVSIQDLEWLEAEVHGDAVMEPPPRTDFHVTSSSQDSPYYPRVVSASERGRKAKKAVVVGGGLIGLETVEILVQAGVETHFLIMEDWYWPMAIDGGEGRFVAEVMEENGVHVHMQTVVEEFVGDANGAVTGVRTKVKGPEAPDDGMPGGDGWVEGPNIDCDIAVITIGVMPNTDWLQDSDIELDERFRGITVNDGLATSAPDVFAAGDCASVTWFKGTEQEMRRPEQLWYTSRDQGRVAARCMMGDAAVYERETWYNSAKFMDVEYTTAGQVPMDLNGKEEWFHDETGAVRSTTRIITENGTVVGFNMLGRRWDHTHLVRWIDERRSLGYVLDHLNEASFDAEFTHPLELPRVAAG